ncbi:molybdopterin-guanine dinucleotide biosynthesis protein B [Methanobacterium lacus]|uniref:Molybdopterin-guanine dinucleotide biosynthesis protein B n=1 Tax=Methanobacterium lacus (strain AL-21) TaxID=877455 RepID=F0T795_METLA|nr:molybdopterin-guanine dinucleotide biosynthesis protein B [Methanobacterium lacus]ADZ10729.1 molybdopterin-guanine dinucleotide biosynthesis protein B [Methanobacterium lacus]
MRIIAVVGTKNTGKTTLVTKIVAELVERGFSVGTVKHTHHQFDLPERDTGKHKAAGAEIVAGIGSETFISIKDSMDLEKVLLMMKFMKDLDFVVIEGLKESKYAKISTSEFKDEFTIANVDVFNMDDAKLSTTIDLVLDRSFGMVNDLNCKKCGYESCDDFVHAKLQGRADAVYCRSESDRVILKINDTMIPLNPFVRTFIDETVLGMVKSLKTDEFGAENLNKIELLIRDKHEND